MGAGRLAAASLRAPRGPLASSPPQRHGTQPRGFHTGRPAAPEEAAAQENVAEMKRKTGRCGLQALTMEGAAQEAPTPCCFPFSARFPPGLALPTAAAAPRHFRSLTDPRWPSLGFLRSLRLPEVTPLTPGVPPISADGASAGCCC